MMGAKGHLPAASHRNGSALHRARLKVATLIKLVIGGDVQLGHHAQKLAGTADGCHIVELGVHPQRQPYHREASELCGALDIGGQATLGSDQKSVLPKEVVAGVSGEDALGKDDHLGPMGHGAFGFLDAGNHVEVYVAHVDRGSHRSDGGEAKLHGVLLSKGAG